MHIISNKNIVPLHKVVSKYKVGMSHVYLHPYPLLLISKSLVGDIKSRVCYTSCITTIPTSIYQKILDFRLCMMLKVIDG